MHPPLVQLTVAKSPLCCRESFVVGIEDKGLVMDWEATGIVVQTCVGSEIVNSRRQPRYKGYSSCHQILLSLYAI